MNGIRPCICRRRRLDIIAQKADNELVGCTRRPWHRIGLLAQPGSCQRRGAIDKAARRVDARSLSRTDGVHDATTIKNGRQWSARPRILRRTACAAFRVPRWGSGQQQRSSLRGVHLMLAIPSGTAMCRQSARRRTVNDMQTQTPTAEDARGDGLDVTARVTPHGPPARARRWRRCHRATEPRGLPILRRAANATAENQEVWSVAKDAPIQRDGARGSTTDSIRRELRAQSTSRLRAT